MAARSGVIIEAWSAGSPTPKGRCVVVSTMGILADIYALGRMAYIGGGFRRGGLHAVAEPAAFSVPVIVGPHYESSSDAALLVQVGGGQALRSKEPEDSMIQLWLSWLEQDEERNAAGLRARATLQQGAADVTAKRLVGLLRDSLHETPSP